jgi:HlyD family secretion protein
MDRELGSEVRRARLIRRIGLGAAAVVALGALVLLAVHWLRPSVDRDDVRIARVERGSLEAIVRAAGIVVPAGERVLSCPVEARVVRTLRQPGAVLQADDIVLELDTSATRLELSKLEERLAQIGNDRTQRKLEFEASIAGLERTTETQRLDLEIARYRLEQHRKLDAEGLVSAEALKQAEVTVGKAEIQLRKLQDEIAAARDAHEARLQRLDLDARMAEREIGEIRRKLELATTRIEEAGVLTWVIDEPGSSVHPGDVLARIADLDTYRVEATVSDAYAPRLEIGLPTRVLIGEVSLQAAVTRILPTIENGAVKFVVDLEDPSHTLLRHNLRVDVLVVTGFRPDVLKIPRGPYIRGGGDLHEVFVVHGDRAVRTDIRLGLVGHEYYELVEGLAEGDEIILSDLTRKRHAKQIRVK